MPSISPWSLICLTVGANLAWPTFATPSPGCSNTTASSEVKTDSTTRAKLGDRNFLLYVPSRYDALSPSPLILSYHGGSRDAEHQAQLDQFNSTFFNKDFLVVYPNAVNTFWQGSPGATSDDIAFTKKILSQVGQDYCVDTDRIFATGKSQGGGMAALLAGDAELSKQIAAFAPVSGAFYVQDEAQCKPRSVSIPATPARADIPMLEFHGLADDVIPYDGGEDKGECLPAIGHFAQSWARLNGLDPESNTTSRIKEAKNNDSMVFQFGEGERLGLVTHVMVGEDIGHDWPSTEDNEDNTLAGHRRASFNASSVIIDFFNAHPLPASRDTVSAANSSAGITQDGTNASGTGSGEIGQASAGSGLTSNAEGLLAALSAVRSSMLVAAVFWCLGRL